MDIRRILDQVENLSLVMPEFQREYVWSLDDAKQLFVSLSRGYPTGSLLFWEATGDNVPEIKNNATLKDKIGSTTVILDGQQRVTTLYLLMKGEIPPYYTEKDLLNDPRHLYYNLKDGEFQYFMKSKMEGNPLWQRVVDCFDIEKINALDIADEYVEKFEDEDHRVLSRKINDNLNKLRAIANIDYPIQTVPVSANIDEAIDVFDRVNSQGTKLTDAELVLSHITGKWPHARRELKKKMQALKEMGFTLNLDLLTRFMVIALTESALYKKNAKLDYDRFTEEDYIDAWQKVVKALDYVIPILKQDALISSSNDMSTMNVLVPLVTHLMKHGYFTEQQKHGFLYWLFLALIWARYSGQTDQRLDKDVYIVLNEEEPIAKLVEEIEDQRGRIVLKPSDLEGRGAGHPLYRMLYIVTKHNKAIDWVNGGSIYDTVGDYYSIQSHHIFPVSLLYDSGYDSENHLDKKKVNEIANRAFVTRDANFDISNRYPSEYLSDVQDKFPGSLEKQFIPNNPDLWELEKYEKFLEVRRQLITDEMNAFLTDLLEKSNSTDLTAQRDWREIIDGGENDYVEFKSTLRWDMREERVNKRLEQVIAKTISAFLNSEGGTLFIGVNDDGEVIGLDNDYKTLDKKQDRDGFLLALTNTINNYLGRDTHQYITSRVLEIEGKDVGVIEVSNSAFPVYVQSNQGDEFYIRASASSQPMGIREATDYISTHWANG